MHSIMANLNLGQDVAKKRRIYTAAHIVANSYPPYLAVKRRRYGSLIKINPSGLLKSNLCGALQSHHYCA